MGFQSQPATPIDISLPDLQYQGVFVESGFAGLDVCAPISFILFLVCFFWGGESV